MTREQRLDLRRRISDEVRRRLDATRECPSCRLELPRDAFRPGRRSCLSCEADAAQKRRRAA
jgi:hypothetical protein